MSSLPTSIRFSTSFPRIPKISFDPFYCCTSWIDGFRYWHGCILVFSLQILWAAVDLFLVTVESFQFQRFGPDVPTSKWLCVWRLSIIFGLLGLLSGLLGMFATLKKRKRSWARAYTALSFIVTILTYSVLLLGLLVLEELPSKSISREGKRCKINFLIFYYTAYLAFNTYATLCGYGLFRYCSKLRIQRARELAGENCSVPCSNHGVESGEGFKPINSYNPSALDSNLNQSMASCEGSAIWEASSSVGQCCGQQR